MESNITAPMPQIPIVDTLNYLALGDSYTIGESVAASESFPYQLAALLPGHKVNTPTIIAKTGWTTDQLVSAIDNSDIKDKTYDIVTLLIGVNDQYSRGSQENYRTKFIQVLNTAIKFAKGDKTRVFVLSIPDYGVTPFANGKEAIIGPEIDQFNNINRQASANAGVHYIDITPISKQAADNLTLIANDGLHPSAIMYHYWVEQLKPVIISRLNKK
ncbi:SGNH/GDSL hydrolase family protein [Mucilaginibacter aquaedulcis]|uniref:SGNH/GDSL hydrolase family protein n=1 Tax=Mucilaginibacter aquaedulcis TaxID=1187081 RepID=UPI0025B2AB91|nr:SGNH/GDSL hydrolase family protein [Mucilaginibacter aquaedulcis]MDN3551842.1 SGNH/GDSL hydrolase family protein [Mucilaginibacter aquaedulcis]